MCSKTILTDCQSEFLIHYRIEKDRFRQIISSITAQSVMLIGISDHDNRNIGNAESRSYLIALMPLSEPVDPDQTAATLEGDDLVLRLIKRGCCVSEDTTAG